MGLKFNPFTGALDQVAVVNQGDFNDLFIDANGNVGIGTTSPDGKMQITTSTNKDIRIRTAAHDTLTSGLGSAITFSRASDGAADLSAVFGWNNGGLVLGARQEIVFATGGGGDYGSTIERARIDSDGRLLVGTNSAATVGNAQVARIAIKGYPGSASGQAIFSLQSDLAPTSINVNNRLGEIGFNGADGSPFAEIYGEADANAGSGNYPGRLVFATTPAGDNSPDPRMTIKSDGKVGIGTETPATELEVEVANDGGNVAVQVTNQVSGGGSSATTASLNLAPSSFTQSLAQLQAVRESTWGSATTRRTGLALKTTQDTGDGPQDRVYITSTGSVGIGTTSPSRPLTLQSDSSTAFGIVADSDTTLRLALGYDYINDYARISSEDVGIDQKDIAQHAKNHRWGRNNSTEYMRLDSSGRLLVGTASSTNVNTRAVFQGYGTSTNEYAIVCLKRGDDPPSVGSGLGLLSFGDKDADHVASIGAFRDTGTWTHDSSEPTRLVFRTTPDGSTSPSPRMTIKADGKVGIGTTNPGSILDIADNGNPTITFNDLSDGRSASINGDAGNLTLTPSTAGSRNVVFKTISGSESARIDSSGRLLVGTDTTSAICTAVLQGHSSSTTANGLLLLARGTTTPGTGQLGTIRFSDSSHDPAAEIAARPDGGTWTSGVSQPTRLEFYTTPDGSSSPTERLRINKDGFTFLVSTVSGLEQTVTASAGTSTFLFRGRYGGTAGVFGSGTSSFQVWSNGNVENTLDSYGAISDIKLKENIVDAESQWDDFKAVRFRKYNFKEETGHETFTQLGVIAQELELVSPGLVYETPDLDEDGNDLGTTTKAVKYSILTKKALVALQEAMERIEQLEAKVAALEAQ